MKAKIDFLWYKSGDDIREEDMVHVNEWSSQGFVDKEVSKDVIVEKEADSVADKVKDVVEDLLDDGKLNDSNKKRSSKGRPKKQK